MVCTLTPACAAASPIHITRPLESAPRSSPHGPMDPWTLGPMDLLHSVSLYSTIGSSEELTDEMGEGGWIFQEGQVRAARQHVDVRRRQRDSEGPHVFGRSVAIFSTRDTVALDMVERRQLSRCPSDECSCRR